MSILQGLDPQAIAKAFDPKNAIDVADYKNCKLIECQKCGFRFDAAHCFSDGTYDCPVCNESDLGAQLVALEKRIAELERERDALRLSLNTTNVIVNDQIGKIADLIKERDAAIEDARALVGYADYARRMTGVFYTRDENEIINKYLAAEK